MAIADGKISTKKANFKSESYKLEQLGNALKIQQYSQTNLEYCWKNGNLRTWFDERFNNEYKNFDEITDIYPITTKEKGVSQLQNCFNVNKVADALLKKSRHRIAFAFLLFVLTFLYSIPKLSGFQETIYFYALAFFLYSFEITIFAKLNPIRIGKLLINENSDLFEIKSYKWFFSACIVFNFLLFANWSYTIINESCGQNIEKFTKFQGYIDDSHLRFDPVSTEYDCLNNDKLNLYEVISFEIIRYFCFYRWAFEDTIIRDAETIKTDKRQHGNLVKVTYYKGYFSGTKDVFAY